MSNTSRPAWGGWIEMGMSLNHPGTARCPVPHGAGGLK